MELTTDIVSKYVGGQLEIYNRGELYLFRGEIESAEVVPEERTESMLLKIRFKWLAKREDNKWHADSDLDYKASLIGMNVYDLSDGRIHYFLIYVGESCTFFPPDGSKLDPARVEGLTLIS